MSELGPIYSRYLITPSQISNKADLGRMAILGETKRDGDGNESAKKEHTKEPSIIVNQNQLRLLFKCKFVIRAAFTIHTCHTSFPTSSSCFPSRLQCLS